MFQHINEFHAWYEERSQANDYRVTPSPLTDLDGWRIEPGTENIVHRTGKFFSVQGLRITTDHRARQQWSQPIIVQPEIGVLGIVVRAVDGVVQCLMQAKMEPGNINTLQLSPTVQATKSNYTRVHQGGSVPYLEHFVDPHNALFDALQSEQGSWFLNKRNRNMIVEVTEDLPLLDDFCWLTLNQLNELLAVPNLVNMDSRTVLSGMPFVQESYTEGEGHSVRQDPLHTFENLLSWFTDVKSRYYLDRRLVPLNEVPDWHLLSGRIEHESGRYFTVLGVDIEASNREVSRWSQPMLQPVGRGVIAFLGKHINDTFHVLVHARTEAGTHDVVEMAPTVSCIPRNYDGVARQQWPLYLDTVLDADPSSVLFDVVHSEEGGRFYHAEDRYTVIDVGEDFGIDTPRDYCWMTVEQLTAFVRYGNYVNVAARCLLSCLPGALSRLAVARA
ncbi:NDP-hexose 2,3-dehydratase family protein [Amycolatopsis sp. NPDC059090]|uniref:NDP-hexose 2,3-dehydratase family protein n=1 Tax=unclassified Amycolatopsis TaxID=2618356 RepID=UPI00366AEF5D